MLSDPKTGVSLGNNVFKIRLKISGKGKGKSGGARVITYIETDLIAKLEVGNEETVVNLISIYDKSDTEIITEKELKRLIANL